MEKNSESVYGTQSQKQWMKSLILFLCLRRDVAPASDRYAGMLRQGSFAALL